MKEVVRNKAGEGFDRLLNSGSANAEIVKREGNLLPKRGSVGKV